MLDQRHNLTDQIRFDQTFYVVIVGYQNGEQIGDSLEMEKGTQMLVV
ncbi:hypothetical protein M595_0289 [Lyngbya aestuarii BL J]|uniref:Uncharacterized protein n=1 Tax=Lyngbya aestuarii BL J TaxID=1348334 RepID=U7QR86_9CYAN|nr:hypothetical protein [Lyngbya aestuarii]ERT09635.1 hypothetical protein M595_0289 [Lyngbya aestuarii BL J]